jgi:hypothetical protein
MKKLNFGCGKDIKEGWDNVDMQEGLGVRSFNFNEFPYPLKNDEYNFILIKHVLNFVDEADKCLYELWNKCKPNAIIEIILPYYNNKGAYNDIQAKHYFSDSTFKVFIVQPCKINKQKKFEIENLKLMPSAPGKLIPRVIRERLSLFIGGLISELYIKLRVIK